MANLKQKDFDAKEDYPNFQGHHSLLSKYLTEATYCKLRDQETPSGYTLDKAIQNGVDNSDFHLGLLAGDEETYSVFAELFDPVIEEYHNGFKKTDNHVTDLSPEKVSDDILDPDYVISSRIRTGRNIRGFALSPHVARSERRQIEKLVSEALCSLGDELTGKYYSLLTLAPEDQQQLIDDHFLFEKPISRHFTSGGMARDFPDGRGIWHNDEKNFLVWINEEDHTRIISMEKGGNMKAVFERFCKGLKEVEKHIQDNGKEFMWNEHLGFILTCPSNLGTGVRCSVHAKLPCMAKDPRFGPICTSLRLQKRGTSGEFTESIGGVYDISNLDRLGSSEVEQVQRVIDGVKLLIEMEKKLEKGESIDDLVPKGTEEAASKESKKAAAAATAKEGPPKATDDKPAQQNSDNKPQKKKSSTCSLL
ncbi:arginine kinase-like [Anneissia japonica]|uniref:arginine kinase-like n=1 Tax=Anneissia japonica TaxID=1529436 RepID=UPI001425763F|nr:arginine kinase-like [Anneissia japonica]